MIRSHLSFAISGTGKLGAVIVELLATAGYRVAMIDEITDADGAGETLHSVPTDRKGRIAGLAMSALPSADAIDRRPPLLGAR